MVGPPACGGHQRALAQPQRLRRDYSLRLIHTGAGLVITRVLDLQLFCECQGPAKACLRMILRNFHSWCFAVNFHVPGRGDGSTQISKSVDDTDPERQMLNSRQELMFTSTQSTQCINNLSPSESPNPKPPRKPQTQTPLTRKFKTFQPPNPNTPHTPHGCPSRSCSSAGGAPRHRAETAATHLRPA